ncbi:hypothetical protein RSAG8_03569, partial [Rhizoctonia solani AG-8 WAC10335]
MGQAQASLTEQQLVNLCFGSTDVYIQARPSTTLMISP